MAKEYNISKSAGQCRRCEKQLDVGEEFIATVRQNDEEFLREDYCTTCWDAREKENPTTEVMFGVWRSHVPPPQEKKRTFVDDELLINFFERLSGEDDPIKTSFRFVLALALMRKKLLVYDKLVTESDGREVWKMHFKGSDQIHDVIDPAMDEDKIAEVSEQLGQILQGEL